jgi:hypothetical protein
VEALTVCIPAPSGVRVQQSPNERPEGHSLEQPRQRRTVLNTPLRLYIILSGLLGIVLLVLLIIIFVR